MRYTARSRVSFDFDWQFHLGDERSADPQAWRSIQLPHDWSIEGPSTADAPGGGPHGYSQHGIGWYRRTFNLDASLRDRSHFIEFDGVYHNTDVYLNGRHIGRKDYGYIGFELDLTPHLDRQGRNLLEVRVDNADVPNCRWYSGSGIYRHVWLTAMHPAGVDHWGVRITTPRVEERSADVRVRTRLRAIRPATSLRTSVLDDREQVIAQMESMLWGVEADQILTIDRPRRWSVEDPQLYRVRSEVIVDGVLVDDCVSPLGIRSAVFDKDRGFLLNGVPTKMKGVCLHHDGGCVGAAVPERVLERRLQILKGVGCNAIRTSHNPPAPELLDLCDRMGFLVIEEAFDKWEGDFSPHWWMKQARFAENWETDLRAMLDRDVNHPCVVLWSVGNENGMPGTDEVDPTLKRLAEFTRDYEPSRPVTAALINSNAKTRDERVARVLRSVSLVDVACLNYQEPMYRHLRAARPDVVIIGSETFKYWRGSEMNVHAFEAVNPWWDVEKHDYVAGGFLWPGIDYLGESTTFPKRGWDSGIIDSCGFLKPEGWFQRCAWIGSVPCVRIGVYTAGPGDVAWSWAAPSLEEHWDFPGLEGRLLRLQTQTNCESVELIVNGTSFGTRRSSEYPNRSIVWHVPYKPGRVEAIGYVAETPVARHELATAGPAARIDLSVDCETLQPDGRDCVHLVATLVDEQGVRVQSDVRPITVTIGGEADLIGIDNGDLACGESYQGPTRTSRRGRVLAIVRSRRVPGRVTIRVESAGLPPATLQIEAREPVLPAAT